MRKSNSLGFKYLGRFLPFFSFQTLPWEHHLSSFYPLSYHFLFICDSPSLSRSQSTIAWPAGFILAANNDTRLLNNILPIPAIVPCVSFVGFKLSSTFLHISKHCLYWGLRSVNEWGWGKWKEDIILGLRGINIVFLKKSVCFPDWPSGTLCGTT